MSLDPISDMLTPFLENLGLNQPDMAARVSLEWSELVGEPWASQGRPVGLQDGQLVLDVVDAATVSLLRYRTGELLARLDDQLGEGVVEVIRLRVARSAF